MIASLAFVPTADLDEAIDVLGTRLPRELLPTLYWFEQNYVGAWTRHHSRREPLFPPSIWSTYERTLAGIDRTNNFAEAARRRIRSEFGADHPTLWRFIDGLRKVQAGRDMEYEQYVRGEQPPHKRQKYQKADNNILAIDGSVSRTNSPSPRAIASTDPSEALWPSLEDRRAQKNQWRSTAALTEAQASSGQGRHLCRRSTAALTEALVSSGQGETALGRDLCRRSTSALTEALASCGQDRDGSRMPIALCRFR
uniref:Uncharacterized protein n=1 Tax=Trichuris muris TaxID=70415 RepID=A0A5S6QC00_TRIMR